MTNKERLYGVRKELSSMKKVIDDLLIENYSLANSYFSLKRRLEELERRTDEIVELRYKRKRK